MRRDEKVKQMTRRRARRHDETTNETNGVSEMKPQSTTGMDEIRQDGGNERTVSDESKHILLILFSPDPLLSAFPYPPASNVPPPPGRGMSGREQDSRAGAIMRLRAMRACRTALSLRSFAIPYSLRECVFAPFLSAHFGDPWRRISIRGGGVQKVSAFSTVR